MFTLPCRNTKYARELKLMASHTMKPEVGTLCHGRMHQEDDAHHVYVVHEYVHHTHTLITEDKQRPIPLSSRLVHDTGVTVLGGVVVGWLKAHVMSPAASRLFPIVLGDTAGATCARISSLDAVPVDTAARTMRRS